MNISNEEIAKDLAVAIIAKKTRITENAPAKAVQLYKDILNELTATEPNKPKAKVQNKRTIAW